MFWNTLILWNFVIFGAGPLLNVLKTTTKGRSLGGGVPYIYIHIYIYMCTLLLQEGTCGPLNSEPVWRTGPRPDSHIAAYACFAASAANVEQQDFCMCACR